MYFSRVLKNKRIIFSPFKRFLCSTTLKRLHPEYFYEKLGLEDEERDFINLKIKDENKIINVFHKDRIEELENSGENIKCGECTKAINNPHNLKICPECGSYECITCIKTNKCKSCNSLLNVSSLPLINKLISGEELWRINKSEITDRGFFSFNDSLVSMCINKFDFSFSFANQLIDKNNKREIVVANHDLEKSFEKGENQNLSNKITKIIQMLNFLRFSIPFFFHNCGFDSELIRFKAIRYHFEDQKQKCIYLQNEKPELFIAPVYFNALPSPSNLKQKTTKLPLFGRKKIFEDMLLCESDFNSYSSFEIGEIGIADDQKQLEKKSSAQYIHTGIFYKKDFDNHFAKFNGEYYVSKKGSFANNEIYEEIFIFKTDYEASCFQNLYIQKKSKNFRVIDFSHPVGTDSYVGIFGSDKNSYSLAIFREGNFVCSLILQSDVIVAEICFPKLLYDLYRYSFILQQKILKHQFQEVQ